MANKKKNFYYVLVMTGYGPVFVTDIHYADKTAEWNKTKKPLEVGEYRAKDLAMGLQCNGHLAYAVSNFYELDTQPYRYDIGELTWKDKEEESKKDS